MFLFKNRNTDLEYSTVEFSLTNPTNTAINVNLFDNNNLTDVPSALPVGAYPNTLGRIFPTYSTANCIAIDDTRSYIAVADTSQSFGIANLKTGETIVSFTSSSYFDITELIYVPATDKYYAVRDNEILIQINSTTGLVEAEIDISLGLDLKGLAFNVQNNNLYFADNISKQVAYVNVYSFNLASINYILGLPAVGAINNVLYIPLNNYLYVLNNGALRFSLIDCSTNLYVSDLTVGIGEPTAAVFNSVNNQLYYYDAATTLIKILNIPSNTLSATTILLAGKIFTISYSANTNHFWAYSNSNAVYIIDCNSDTLVNTLPLPSPTLGKLQYSTSLNTVYITAKNASLPFISELIAPSAAFYIVGSSDYNLFVRDSLYNPKKVDRIMIYAELNSNLTNAVQINTEDASGLSCSDIKLPNTTVGTAQYQGQISQLDFDNLILDLNTSLNYNIPAFTTISWVLYYKQYHTTDLLSGSVNITEFDATPINDPSTYDEKFLIDTDITAEWTELMQTKTILKK